MAARNGKKSGRRDDDANGADAQGGTSYLTKEQQEEAVHLVLQLLSRAAPKWKIKAALRQRYRPDMSARQIERYIARAREVMRSELKEADKDDLRAEAHAVYRAVIQDPKARPAEKVAAQKAICELFGLDAPSQLDVNQPNAGMPPKVQVTVINAQPANAPVPRNGNRTPQRITVKTRDQNGDNADDGSNGNGSQPEGG